MLALCLSPCFQSSLKSMLYCLLMQSRRVQFPTVLPSTLLLFVCQTSVTIPLINSLKRRLPFFQCLVYFVPMSLAKWETPRAIQWAYVCVPSTRKMVEVADKYFWGSAGVMPVQPARDSLQLKVASNDVDWLKMPQQIHDFRLYSISNHASRCFIYVSWRVAISCTLPGGNFYIELVQCCLVSQRPFPVYFSVCLYAPSSSEALFNVRILGKRLQHLSLCFSVCTAAIL
jgi:hypothetical protein